MEEPSEVELCTLAALLHLENEFGLKRTYNLAEMATKSRERWHIDVPMVNFVQGVKWLASNELIVEKSVGFNSTKLGLEYLKWKLPDFVPLPPLPPEVEPFHPLPYKKRNRGKRGRQTPSKWLKRLSD